MLGFRARAALSWNSQAESGIPPGVRGGDANGRGVDGWLAIERRDKPRGSSRAPRQRRMVVFAANLPQIPFQDMGVCV